MSPRGTRTLQRLAELLERHRSGTRIGLRPVAMFGHGRDVAPGSELKQELHKARDQRIIRAECCGYLNIKALSHLFKTHGLWIVFFNDDA